MNNPTDIKTLGDVLREAFDDYSEQNPPEHVFGSDDYYKWYHAQNEFVAQAVVKAAEEGLLLLSESNAVKAVELQAELKRAHELINECEKSFTSIRNFTLHHEHSCQQACGALVLIQKYKKGQA